MQAHMLQNGNIAALSIAQDKRHNSEVQMGCLAKLQYTHLLGLKQEILAF